MMGHFTYVVWRREWDGSGYDFFGAFESQEQAARLVELLSKAGASGDIRCEAVPEFKLDWSAGQQEFLDKLKATQ